MFLKQIHRKFSDPLRKKIAELDLKKQEIKSRFYPKNVGG